MTDIDPWAVIGDVFGAQPKPEPPPRPPILLGSAAPDTRYAASALEQEAQRVIDCPPGGRNHALNRAAFSLGQLVAGGALQEEDVRTTLGHAARQAGLEDREIGQTITSGLRSGAEQPRGIPDKPAPSVAAGFTATPDGGAINTSTGEILTPEELAERAHQRRVRDELAVLRARDEAKRLFEQEKLTKQWREPASVRTLADELLIPDQPVQYAIEELLPIGANALLAAQFKTGKTTFINNYARAFADGGLFLGRYQVNPAGGRVALSNYELPRDMNRRWLRDMNIQNPDRVSVLNLRGFRLPITSPVVEDWIVRWLLEREVTAWVVDPFARAAVGTDENSNTDVGVWLDTLDIIKERAGVRDLILPTHTGRAEQEQGQERARGATRLDDWADVRWLLTKDDSDTRYFRATGRDIDVAEEKLTFEEDTRSLTIGGGDRRWEADRQLAQQVLDVVNANPGLSGRAIKALVRHNKGKVEDTLAELVRRHKVRREDAKNGHAHYANDTNAM